MSTYYTVGHSTRALAEFLALLQGAGVERLVDVRAIPRSRTNPQFNIDTLPPALAEHGIDYEHLAELGGRRRGAPHSANDFWENDSFRSYADYAGTEAFRAGLERLKKLGRERPLPSPHHRRLSDFRRRDRLAHSCARKDRAREIDSRRAQDARRHFDLSERSGLTGARIKPRARFPSALAGEGGPSRRRGLGEG
jgi:uncharacterized protein (DUF488 family)